MLAVTAAENSVQVSRGDGRSPGTYYPSGAALAGLSVRRGQDSNSGTS